MDLACTISMPHLIENPYQYFWRTLYKRKKDAEKFRENLVLIKVNILFFGEGCIIFPIFHLPCNTLGTNLVFQEF